MKVNPSDAEVASDPRSVKIVAAQKHSTFPQTFFNLAFSYDYEVRALIACHAETPSSSLGS